MINAAASAAPAGDAIFSVGGARLPKRNTINRLYFLYLSYSPFIEFLEKSEKNPSLASIENEQTSERTQSRDPLDRVVIALSSGRRREIAAASSASLIVGLTAGDGGRASELAANSAHFEPNSQAARRGARLAGAANFLWAPSDPGGGSSESSRRPGHSERRVRARMGLPLCSRWPRRLRARVEVAQVQRTAASSIGVRPAPSDGNGAAAAAPEEARDACAFGCATHNKHNRTHHGSARSRSGNGGERGNRMNPSKFNQLELRDLNAPPAFVCEQACARPSVRPLVRCVALRCVALRCAALCAIPLHLPLAAPATQRMRAMLGSRFRSLELASGSEAPHN